MFVRHDELEMVVVVTYLWHGAQLKPEKYAYGADDVRILQRMVRRHLTVPHQFAVITDRQELFSADEAIRAVPIDKTTHVSGTCFVRLMTFSPMMADIFGKGTRVLQIDLDSMIVGNINALVDRDEDIVLWRNPRRWCLTYPDVGYAAKLAVFNASILLHRCGTMDRIWRNFDPEFPQERDDQWWLSLMVGKDCPYWDGSHGIIGWR